MPITFTPMDDGTVQVDNLLHKYGEPEFGRWTTEWSGNYPDRCEDCPLADIKPATHYYKDKNRKGVVFYNGLCPECAEKRKGAKKIP